MRKYLAALLLVPMLALAGCQSTVAVLNTSVPNVVTQAHVDQANLGYQVLSETFKIYRKRPYCLTGQDQIRNRCQLRAVALQIQSINARARASLGELQRFELTHRGQATLQGMKLYQAAYELIESAKYVIAINGIPVQ